MTDRIIPKRHTSPGRRITAVAPGIVLLLALFWLGHDLNIDERIVLFRYLCMAFAGAMAFITPHLLFPDGDKTLIQQLNLSPRHLLLHHVTKVKALWFFSIAAVFIIAFGDSSQPTGSFHEKTRLLGMGIVALSAVMLYALYCFATIGETSQRWNEGKIGKQVFDSMEKVGKSTPVAAGMYPTFISTILVTFFGMMSVVVSASIPQAQLAVVPFAALAAYSGFRLGREAKRYDRLYYQSDAFYDELFTNPSTGTKESREPAGYDAVYWVPGRWRPAVWSQIIQLDRKRPMGRIIALLSFTYFLLIYLGVPESWHSGWLIFWILSKNMLAWPASQKAMSPPLFHWWMMPPHDWIAARFFLQLRWTFVLLLTTAAAALFSGAVTWTAVGIWIILDVFVSLLSAVVLTRINEYAFKKRYV
ncbi:hypothetical protein [Natronogracilivirga saccharolytica]|uniref:Uncharacterized protein n=1 Tax=Natronogracilivirga saccharolytica TaxID=2812953 RepID=A0A8J7RIB7_9BACT|nr:hypothetical protein [Natronogracilivirga saccharolytica]MBP3191145.1 hypothetical protein [Natronogracilivirga saccharolytica]